MGAWSAIVMILRLVDKQLLRAASIWVHYTTKEDDKRLVGGICLVQFGLLNLRTQSLI
jgi:hypothetical protein